MGRGWASLSAQCQSKFSPKTQNDFCACPPTTRRLASRGQEYVHGQPSIAGRGRGPIHEPVKRVSPELTVPLTVGWLRVWSSG